MAWGTLRLQQHDLELMGLREDSEIHANIATRACGLDPFCVGPLLGDGFLAPGNYTLDHLPSVQWLQRLLLLISCNLARLRSEVKPLLMTSPGVLSTWPPEN